MSERVQQGIVKKIDCWQAVVNRDTRLDGVFVAAVRSTGIYCRPSCPARRPRRDRVIFFARPEEAERAGFRPCRRCQPNSTMSLQMQLVQRVCRYIEMNSSSPLTLAALSKHVGVSPYHLQRTFKRVIGITPRQYAEAQRLTKVKEHLRNGHDVTRSLYAAGYGSSSRLYEKARSRFGMTPGIYRRGGRGMQIFYSVVNCPLGRLLVAATERGLCAVNFGNSDTELEAALRREYPTARVQKDETHLKAWTKALQEYFNGREFDPHLSIDIQATAFQWRVWQALRKIPYGETRSYSEIAKAIGKPKAVRAVANACARNPVGLVIPCHRVIREDGSLGGYGGGIERKRALLSHEGALEQTSAE